MAAHIVRLGEAPTIRAMLSHARLETKRHGYRTSCQCPEEVLCKIVGTELVRFATLDEGYSPLLTDVKTYMRNSKSISNPVLPLLKPCRTLQNHNLVGRRPNLINSTPPIFLRPVFWPKDPEAARERHGFRV